MVLVLGGIYFLYTSSKSELAPQEDQGFVLAQATSAPNATLAGKSLYDAQGFDIGSAVAHPDHVFQIDSPGQVIMGFALPPRDKRKLGANEIQQQLSQHLGAIAGQKIAVFQPPSLPGAFGLPIQFAITTTEPPARLNEVTQPLLAAAQKSGMFIFIDTDLKYDLPQAVIEIDRRQGRAARPDHESGRHRLGIAAGRQLRELLQHGHAVLQGHPPGRAPVAAERRSVAELSGGQHRRRAGISVEHRHHPHR